MRPGKVLLVVFGVLVGIVGVALVIGGTAGLVFRLAFSDRDGFVSSGEFSLRSSAYAIVSEAARIGGGWPRITRDLATIRIEVRASDPGRALFVGVADWRDAQAYLAGVARDEVVDVELRPVRTGYRSIPGGPPPEPPGGRAFWMARAEGVGTQTLTWDVRPGEWMLVLMNADGAQGVEASAVVGARVPWLLPLTIGVLVGGVVLLLLAVALIYVGVRGRPLAEREPQAEPGSGYPLTITGELSEPLSPALWLVKWFLLIPHFVVLVFLWVGFCLSWLVSLGAILFTGRYPRSLFDYNVGVLRWTWRVGFYSYQALGTDRYPPFTLQAGGYPADLDVVYPERLSRGLVLVKWWLLALPHYAVVSLFQGGGGQHGGGGLVPLLSFFAGVALLFRGKYPRGIFAFVMDMNRWTYRVAVYAALMTDRYPPFRLGE
jgi:hypothetical protein